jgi:hypothetical protein
VSEVENIVRLKNKYTGDIVYTKSYDTVDEQGGMKFIRVYNEKNPERTYMANKEAFEVLSDK